MSLLFLFFQVPLESGFVDDDNVEVDADAYVDYDYEDDFEDYEDDFEEEEEEEEVDGAGSSDENEVAPPQKKKSAIRERMEQQERVSLI